MKYGTRTGNPAKARTQCAIVGVYENGQLSPSARVLDKASKGYLRKILKRDDISGKTNQTLLLHDVPNVGATRVLLVGLGNEKSMSSAKYADIARTVIGKMKATSSRTNLCCLLEVDVPGRSIEWKTQRIVESFEAGLYSFTEMKGKPPVNTVSIESVDLLLDDKSELETVLSAIAVGSALTAGISSAKTLGNLPGNICTPTYLANQAKQLAKDYSSITTKVIEEKEIEKLGMGAFMSVTRGSVQPGKLIVITYKGGKAKEAPHVLVGKGITFDTGGISLKPGGRYARDDLGYVRRSQRVWDDGRDR